jgi:hypothetical protein
MEIRDYRRYLWIRCNQWLATHCCVCRLQLLQVYLLWRTGTPDNWSVNLRAKWGGSADLTFQLTGIESVSVESSQTGLKVKWILGVHRKCTLQIDSFPFPLQLTLSVPLQVTIYKILVDMCTNWTKKKIRILLARCICVLCTKLAFSIFFPAEETISSVLTGK